MDYEDSSGDSSSEGGEQLEAAELLGVQIQLPQGIAENSEIFNEVLSASTWKSLNPSDQAHLMVRSNRLNLNTVDTHATHRYGTTLNTMDPT